MKIYSIFNPISRVNTPSVNKLCSELTAKADGKNGTKGGWVTTPPRNWRGNMINLEITFKNYDKAKVSNFHKIIWCFPMKPITSEKNNSNSLNNHCRSRMFVKITKFKTFKNKSINSYYSI